MARPARRFCFRLAAQLHCTVRELLARITTAELMEWMAYDRIEPIGAGRLNLALANLAAMTANINRDMDKRPEPFDVSDFVPFYVRPPLPEIHDPSAGERLSMEARMKAFFQKRAVNGRQ